MKVKIVVCRVLWVNIQVNTFLSVNVHFYHIYILCRSLADELIFHSIILSVKDDISLMDFLRLVIMVAVIKSVYYFHTGGQSVIDDFLLVTSAFHFRIVNRHSYFLASTLKFLDVCQSVAVAVITLIIQFM